MVLENYISGTEDSLRDTSDLAESGISGLLLGITKLLIKNPRAKAQGMGYGEDKLACDHY